MQFPRLAALVAGILTSVTVNAMPVANSDILGLTSLLKEFKGQQYTDCDLSKAVMPTSDGLSPPDSGLVLSRVVLGRGIQNYTCADSTDALVPVAQGAVANLYDASCLAAKNPGLLHTLPGALVHIDKTVIELAISMISKMGCGDILVGHHYFAPNNTVPVFDFRMKNPQRWILAGTKDQGVPAVNVAFASKGIASEQNGAVDWLRIKAIPSLSVNFKLAYRVQTAGGKSPTTCKGQPKAFNIEYATEYWIYS